MLFTLGYEGLDIDTYIAALKMHHIQTLLDVRELPLSRKKGFSKNVLAARLDAEGIGYRHLRSLGAPRLIRRALRADGDWPEYCRGYFGHLEQQDDELLALGTLAQHTTICLLCFEADPKECHRSLITDRLEARGLVPRAHHLTPQTVKAAPMVAALA